MENNDPRKSGIQQILKTAFWYWNKTLIYQLLYSLLYFSMFFLGYFYLFRYFGLWDEFAKYSDLVKTDIPAFNKKMEEIARLPQARNFGLAFFFLLALINPLNVGLYKIFRKIDLKEPVSMKDLFAGYLGFDFFKFFGFYLFWIIIFTYANALLVLGLVWVFITLFSIPLMFFMDVKTFEGIILTVKGLRKNFGMILIGMLIALLFSLSGFLLFGVGFLLTFPFWNAMIYALYQHIYKEIG
ncbi:hypothetical protein [Kaistella jeonii]|uniref:Beta-carotene 15,15'-monooxygenase n=1 Tax=Kaistella jeonii TaxID=266749 RepID=A0A0C1FA77_9FLAO|nr:hypothetical protein [Kaistella jeonii]KIA90047.1 hypothetical protein OA86_05475 [Kaistella jeonii]SFB78624.1 hypothetical protein SAMN05421876_102195 [Kaistella jeonii]VEI96317.1 Predicted integral membrane protein [Kaistella jeonii]